MSKATRHICTLMLLFLPHRILFADHLGLAGRAYRSINSSGGSSLINHVALVISIDANGGISLLNNDKYIYWTGIPIDYWSGWLIESGTQEENVATMEPWIGRPPSSEFITCSNPCIYSAEQFGDSLGDYLMMGARPSTNRWTPDYYVQSWNTNGGGRIPYNIISNNCYSFVRFTEGQL